MNSLEAIKLLLAAFSTSTDSPKIVAVAGGTCSGKTFFSRTVRRSLGAEKVCILSLDHYYRDSNDPNMPRDNQGYPIFDVPEAYHTDEIIRSIDALLTGKQIRLPYYDLSSNKRVSSYQMLLHPQTLLVLDGLFSFQFMTNYTGLKFYIEAPDDLRLQRRIDRDAAKYNIPEEVIRRFFWERLIPLHRTYVEPQKQLATYVVETEPGDNNATVIV